MKDHKVLYKFFYLMHLEKTSRRGFASPCITTYCVQSSLVWMLSVSQSHPCPKASANASRKLSSESFEERVLQNWFNHIFLPTITNH